MPIQSNESLSIYCKEYDLVIREGQNIRCSIVCQIGAVMVALFSLVYMIVEFYLDIKYLELLEENMML